MIAGSDQFLNGAETTAFLGAIAGFAVILLVFLLYLNKKWCFGAASGAFSCCDETISQLPGGVNQSNSGLSPLNHHNQHSSHSFSRHNFGKAYSLDSPESSSDSELDVIRRLQQSASFHSGQRLGVQGVVGLTTHIQRSPSGAALLSSSAHRPTLNSPPLVSHHNNQNNAFPQDLISLVEKGRVGISSNSSCCSSTNSSIGAPGGTDTHIHHAQMATHRAIAQDIRETRIDNFGEDKNRSGGKYKKLTQESSIESNDNSNQDCIVVLGQESGYDADVQSTCTSAGVTTNGTCDIENGESRDLINKYGHLEVALLYDAPMRKMTVHVLQARDIPSRVRDQPTQVHTQVRLLLLPSKKQKHKTKIRSGDNPQFMESFLLHRINPEDVNSMGLRLRVYGCERMRRERLIGESIVSFSSLDLELETTLWLALEPRAASHHSNNGSIIGSHADLRSLARSDSTGSAQSMQHGGVPELLLGLSYNATTGRLSAEIVKGSHFRNLSMNRAPDTYVKLCLVSSNGQEMARSKTSIRRGQPNPLFKETFVFQVALFQLADVTLMISIYNRKGMTKRKEMIGWFSLGLNSSGPEQLAHWLDMKELHAQQLCRWHVLVDS